MILPEQEDLHGPLRINSLHPPYGFYETLIGEFSDGRESFIPPYVLVLYNPLKQMDVCTLLRIDKDVYLQTRSPLEGKKFELPLLPKSISIGTCRLQI